MNEAHDKPEMCFWKALSLMLERNAMPVQAVFDGRMTVVGAGASAAVEAARYLNCRADELALNGFDLPSNPLQGFMLGQRSSQNHRRLGEATLAIYARRYAPAIYSEARGRVVRQLQHELTVGAWSCPGQEGHEAFGPSHAGHNLAADAAFRAHALEAGDQELLDLTEEHWRRQAEYLRLGMDDAGGVMTAGPRAWDFTKPKVGGGPRSGRSAQLDAAAREIWKPAARFSDARLQGFDMIGPRLMRRGLRIDFKPGHPRMPVTVDPIVLRLSPGAVLAYMESCTANMAPGPQIAALSVGGDERFAVDSRAGLGGNFTDAALFRPDEWLPGPPESQEWRTGVSGSPATPQSAPGGPTSPEAPGPAPTTPTPPPIASQGLAGELAAIVARLREIARGRPAARAPVAAVADDLDRLVGRARDLERSRT